MSRSKRTFFNFLAVIMMVLVLPACSSFPFAKTTPTLTAYPTFRPPRPTRTSTVIATFTALPGSTSTMIPTSTQFPPPDDFSLARLYSSGSQPGWNFSFTLLLPEAVEGDYNALIGDPPKPFTCRPLTEYAHPERLFCAGRIPAADKQVNYFIIEKETGQEVFKGNLYVPVP